MVLERLDNSSSLFTLLARWDASAMFVIPALFFGTEIISLIPCFSFFVTWALEDGVFVPVRPFQTSLMSNLLAPSVSYKEK
jgi:hypothetical protein